jgi:hypothetical protein
MVPNDVYVHEAPDGASAVPYGGTGWIKARKHLKNKNVINLQDNPNSMPQGKPFYEANVSLHSAK